MTPLQSHDLRVLVLAPFGRDGRLTCEVLHDAAIDSLRCEDIGQLRDELQQGAGALVIAAEALHRAAAAELADALQGQPPWSDIPLVLATASGQARAARELTLQTLEPSAHITLLERPIRLQTLVSVVRSALSTRRRQYEMRDLIEALRLSVERLDAEHSVRERVVDLLAHDLRGPLGAGKMSAQLLVRAQTTEQINTLATRIEKSIERADGMIRNLLDAHRLRVGHRLPVKVQRCDLVQIARDALEDLDAREGARLDLQGLDHLEGYWDPDLLRRALWNLLSNALKYGAADGPIELVIGCEASTAWARVHNWGPPIPPEERRQLFEPFARTRSSDAGNQRGWGLGLALVQGVVASHGGLMEVSSESASGTAFTLRVPLDARPFQS